MNQTMLVCGTLVNVDVEKTASLYAAKGMLPRCECDFCWNVAVTERKRTSTELFEILHRLGIDPWQWSFSTFAGRFAKDPPETVRVRSAWLYVGGEATSSHDLRTCLGERLSFGREKADTQAIIDNLRWHFELPERLELAWADRLLPWLPGQVTEFRLERSVPCPQCGGQWRNTGYLKRRSLIPRWEDRPELEHALRERKDRVLVEFCRECGRMESQLVGRVRPFRPISEATRAANRALRNVWDSIP